MNKTMGEKMLESGLSFQELQELVNYFTKEDDSYLVATDKGPGPDDEGQYYILNGSNAYYLYHKETLVACLGDGVDMYFVGDQALWPGTKAFHDRLQEDLMDLVEEYGG